MEKRRVADHNHNILPTVSRPARPTSVRLATIARCLVLLSVFAVLATCYLAQEIISTIMLALLFSLLFSPVVGVMQRLRLPRMLASGLIVLAIIGASVGALYALAQPAKDWISKAPAAIHSVAQRFKDLRGPVQQAQKATESLTDLAGSNTAAQEVIVKDGSNPLTALAAGTPRVLESIAATILLLFFFLSSGDNFLRRLVEIAPGMTEKKIVVSIARDIQREMSRYLQTITIINFGLGCATAIAMALLQVPNSLLWGAMVFLFNFAPYVGATVSAVVLATVGFTTFDSIGHAAAIPGTFLCLAFIEGQLVTPTIIGRRLAVNPVVVFVWLLIWGWLWGLIGILLAGPLLACFRIICQHTEALRPIYVLIGEAKFDETEERNVSNTSQLDEDDQAAASK
ncbi:MAG TPA: AI-2E family transporter [Rudaea sp.]|jgi:predicted PurR-regulated permease PerM|nr:AI-2E family transporter [Rudaea sp.]